MWSQSYKSWNISLKKEPNICMRLKKIIKQNNNEKNNYTETKAKC